MISIDEVLTILREMYGESDSMFMNPSDVSAAAFGKAQGFRLAVSEFDTRLQSRIEALAKDSTEDF